MIDKLQIDEAQIEMVREVMGEHRTAQRETRRVRGEMMKTAFAGLPGLMVTTGKTAGMVTTGKTAGMAAMDRMAGMDVMGAAGAVLIPRP